MAIIAGVEKVLVASATASAAATIDITTGIDSTYDEYELHLIGLRFSTDQTDVYCRPSTDGLSVPTWADGTGSRATSSYTATEGAKFDVSAASGFLWLSHNTASVYKPGNAAGESMSGVVRYYSLVSTSIQRLYFGVATSTVSNGNIAVKTHEISNATGDAIDSIRLYPTVGTVTGELRLYGIVKSL